MTLLTRGAPPLKRAHAANEDLVACLYEAARTNTAIRFVDAKRQSTRVSYETLLRGAERIATIVREAGVLPGQRVGLMFATSEAFVASFFGVLLAGAVPAPLYPPQRMGQLTSYLLRLDGMLQSGDVKMLLGARRAVKLVRPGLSRDVLQRGSFAFDTLDELEHIARLNRALRVCADAIALVQFSSGTTGAPKPVALTHRQLLANIDAMRSVFASYPPPTNVAHSAVSWLPLYHDMGLVGSLLTALREQATLTLIAPEQFVANPALWLQTLSDTQATVSAAPSFAYALCVERIRDEALKDVDLSHWQFALNGAEPVNLGVAKAFSERFARWGLRPDAMTPVYGMAEAGLGVTFCPPKIGLKSALLPERHVCVGRALSGYAVRIDGPKDAYGCGSIAVRGPSIVTDRPDGWLVTGDLGALIDDELYVTGRQKDVVIVRGRNHPAQMIEAAIDALAFVRSGCVVAGSVRREDSEREALVLLVERKRTAKTSAKETAAQKALIGQTLVRELGLVAEHIQLLAPGTLPRTSSGKRRRRAALDAWKKNELVAPAPATLWSIARQLFRARRHLRSPKQP